MPPLCGDDRIADSIIEYYLDLDIKGDLILINFGLSAIN